MLTYQDLLDRGLTEAWVTLCCVSNPVGGDLIGNAWWSGVRVADLLAEAGPLPDADAVLQTSEDGWTCGTPLAALTDDRDAMLAVAMNGEPLPLEHGFPVRMVVPGLYGYVSATKWVVDLEVTPLRRLRRPSGPARLGRAGAGADPVADRRTAREPPGHGRRRHASAGSRGRSTPASRRSRCSSTAARGRQVELGRVPSADTWVQWAGTVDADPGVHTLAVRATDTSGYDADRPCSRDVVPDGATGWHTDRVHRGVTRGSGVTRRVTSCGCRRAAAAGARRRG